MTDSGTTFVGGALHSHIEEWTNITSSVHILDWLKEGVKIPFSTLPPVIEEQNSHFSKDQYTFVKREIGRLLTRKCIVKCESKPHCVSRLSCVPKAGEEQFRLILDLREVNKYSIPPKFVYEDIISVTNLCEPKDKLVTIDIKSGFHHVNVFEPHTTYLGFKFENCYYKFTTLCFGLNASPYFFHKFIRCTIQHFRENNVRIVSYVDDFAIIDNTENIEHSVSYVLEVLKKLGFTINWKKSSLTPDTRKLFIGYVIDTDKSADGIWLEIPKSRIRKVKHDISRAIKNQKTSARALARIAGQLVSMTKVIIPTKLMLRHVYRKLSSRKSWSDILDLDNNSINDLVWWLNSLSAWNGRKLLIKDESKTIQLATDASGLGWGGHIINSNSEAQGFWSPQVSKKSSNFRELQAVQNCLESFAPKLKNSRIQVLTDNVTTAAFINFQGGQSLELSEIARKIWTLVVQLNINISARWLAGKNNILADSLSRQDSPYNWQINQNLFNYLDKLFGPHTVDRFACYQTTMCRKYNSLYLDMETAGIDALVQPDWHQENNWVNPPIYLIPRILEKIIQTQAQATVIAPLWRAMSWTPLLQRLSTAPPVQLPRAHLFCTQIGHQNPEPTKNKRWRFYAWRLHGSRASHS